MLKNTIFREYDIRGIADRDLLSEDIEQLGRAVGTYLRRRCGRRINLGRDCRLSGQRLHDALLAGLMEAGCEVTDIGVVPTPLLYYSVYKFGADGGIMITGSHNPSDYNGFKMMAGKAAVYGQDIQDIQALTQSGDFTGGEGSVVERDVITPYVEEIAGMFAFSRRVKVVFDAGNGTAGPTLKRLLERLNVEAVEMFFEMDGRFPNHHPDPTVEENLEMLKRAVAAEGAEMGIAFDGDSDRIGAIDEKGEVVWGDQLMLIYAREILKRKPGSTFIGEVKCSRLMYEEIEKLGGKAIMYKTGHSLIKTKMKQEHAELAGEMSGHIFFADRYYGYDDALYAACRLIEIVADSGAALSRQLAGMPKLVNTPEIRVDWPDETKFAVVERVKEHFRATHGVNDVDGVRVSFEKGWGLMRASNTQPVLVMRFEAETPEQLAEYRAAMEAALNAAGGCW
ncbi:MAG: phosphomannomutase/phosphoglucomutase [Bryobacter sp.]|jgi:phosphomannomutase/phosphoglucomutase|nr:phosphomannomutase/phosphoglucomutase [Bryobacter sp. CoA8 C33]